MTTPLPHAHAGSTRIAGPAMTYPVRPTQNTRRSFASAMPSTARHQGLLNVHREPAELLDR